MTPQKRCEMVDPPPADPDDMPEVPTFSREEILAVQDIKIIPFHVKAWGCMIHLKSIGAGEWDDFEDTLVEIVDGSKAKSTLADYRARFAVLVSCDEDGTMLFTAADIPALTIKSRAALDSILEAGKKLNGISAGDQEAMVENLKPTPDGDS